MKRFAVYQNNKLANHTSFPEVDHSWNATSFSDFKSAYQYAIKWCGSYPVLPSLQFCKVNTQYKLPFDQPNGEDAFILIRRYITDVHTEHCCHIHQSCKYGEENHGCSCCDWETVDGSLVIHLPSTHGCKCGH